MDTIDPNGFASEELVRIPVEAYVSPEYARAENERLWPKVWQIACREEELKEVGDFATYDILDESIIIIRSAPGEISAYYNVCPHRGRRITKGCGHAQRLHCRFHGCGRDVQGNSTYVLDAEDWGDAVAPEKLALSHVKVDTWGGWAWINMDPDCVSLEEFLSQDFQNIGEIQKGVKSRAYDGAMPSPYQEVPIIHFHRTLAKFMGTGAPVPIGQD
jgi:phenylpropionate dioxygenase-like ring-hydroxylating dioxygenase large terminal subunit